MKVFTRVVETSNFTRAADTLDLPRATVSTIIQRLEAHLKVRLLQRTTRRVSLTTDGTAYYEQCVRILADVEETESSFEHVVKAPRDRLRIDMPIALGRMIVRANIHDFHTQYPDIDLMLGFSDAPTNLIQDGVDCAIRIGTLPDSNLVARRICEYQGVTCASPAYLERHGTPETIEDLERHVAVNYFSSRTGRVMDLSFEVSGEPVQVCMKGNIAVNDADAYIQSALEGAGMVQAPRFIALPYLESGRLVEILPDCKPLPAPISATYPRSRHLPPTVRVFVDWVAALLRETALLRDQPKKEMRAGPDSPVNRDVDDQLYHIDEALA